MQTPRRDFLAGLGGFAFGITGSGLAGAKEDSAIPETPWPYELLDVEEARKRGHRYDYTSNCASGAFIGLVSMLRESVGYPWTTIPLDIYAYAGGGVNGWGTLCGTLNGASGVITLAAGKRDQGRLVNELMGWYAITPLPSTESNRYAREGLFQVEKAIFGGELPSAVSSSPLCHVSIAKWCAAANIGAGTPERAERCARLCGDVTAKTVEILNAWKTGTFAPAYAPRAEVTGCMSCHAPGPDASKKQTSVGKMDCVECHEPHM